MKFFIPQMANNLFVTLVNHLLGEFPYPMAFNIPHPFGQRPLLPARFIDRPNRFIGVFHFDDDPATTYRAHIADPGRLKELLRPGARVWVVDYRDHPTRKLPFAMPYVQSSDGTMVSIYSRLPNWIVEHGLTHQSLPGLAEVELVRREPRFINAENGSKSTFDFEYRLPNGQCALLEVKGASLVESGVCKFPDAPTSRGTRQLGDLLAAHQQGIAARLLFICQRSDAQLLTPHVERDPEFAKAVKTLVDAGVAVNWLKIDISPTNIRLACDELLPITLSQP